MKKIKLPKELTKVTRVSKIMALICFFTIPLITFGFGMKYQKVVDNSSQAETVSPTPILENIEPVACTMDAKICPDGSSVGRVPPTCEFSPCPSTSFTDDGQMCGGIRGRDCPAGYTCKLDGYYPDAAGTCVREAEKITGFECPKTGYINCMPGTDSLRWECSSQYLDWASQNCPGFEGGAY
ncbi:MAG: hypothetical protein ACOYUB_04600 [Patescibacteria group bacterium]